MTAKEAIQSRYKAQCIAVVGIAPISTSLCVFFSGIIFVQFGVFCMARAERVPRPVVISAVTLKILHIGQIFLEFWTIHQSMTHCATGKAYSFSFFASLLTFSSLSVTWVVQYHFSRLINTLMGRPKWWRCLVGSLCLVSLVGGITSGSQFMMLNSENESKKLGPLKLNSSLTGFYTLWFMSNSVYDIIIIWVLSIEVHKHRAQMKTDFIRSTLFRLMILTISTFTLSSILGLTSAASIIALRCTPTSALQSLTRLNTLVLVSNGFMSRIYLISFFSSIAQNSQTRSSYADSCVASLNIIDDSKENMIVHNDNSVPTQLVSNSNHEERTNQAMTYTVNVSTSKL
ncbi:hypothetical protein DFH28DRAFT_904359 [Melampsora americana]|nr:hypothetical protein DFH28DRAFT_904359 [Melampsora americana]